MLLKRFGSRIVLLKTGGRVDRLKAAVAAVPHADPMRGAIRGDWVAQDTKGLKDATFRTLAEVVLSGEAADADELCKRRDKLIENKVASDDKAWRTLYLAACRHRRGKRLAPHASGLRKIVFTKHHDIGGQHYAYTEDVSDSPYNDNNPFPHSGKLCFLEMDGPFGTVRTLLDEPDGLIRDPDVSYDGMKILFARRTHMKKDDLSSL